MQPLVIALALPAVLFPSCLRAQANAALPSAPEPPVHQPLIAPAALMQPNPHTAQVEVEDPPCLSPADSDSYHYQAKSPSAAQSHAMDQYFWEMRKRIYDHWLINQPRVTEKRWSKAAIANSRLDVQNNRITGLEQPNLSKKAIVGVKLNIEKDGTIDPPFVSLPSGSKPFDDHAVKSLQESSPLQPLPGGAESLHTCLFFYYNQRAPEAPKKKAPYDQWLDQQQKSATAPAAPSAPAPQP